MGQNETDGSSYDQVTITSTEGKVRILSRLEFESLPLDERVRVLLSKRLKFFRRGKEVAATEALKPH
jgi:hypothetical protein